MLADLSVLQPETKVRFTAERLSILSIPDRRRLEGRVGVVQTYRNFSKKPLVFFHAEGKREEIRFEVDRKHLEVVEPPPAKLSQDDLDGYFD